MPTPKLTIGLAHHTDWDGLYFTVQVLRAYQDLTDCEILIVDNSPNTEEGLLVKALAGKAGEHYGTLRYIAMPEAGGTTQPRERIFQEARGDYVLVLDCHVLLLAGAVQRLLRFFESNPTCKSILHGPLLADDLWSISTHFEPVWRDEMFGVWGCSQAVPPGLTSSGTPFKTPGMGLGLFACRKDAWPGFNPHFRGFGGEELYIHEKFRRNGGDSLCLPWLRWIHRTDRAQPVRYAAHRWYRIRNYVLGFQELGWDIQPIYDHFVATGLITQAAWDHLLQDPVQHVAPHASCGTTGRLLPQPAVDSDLGGLARWVSLVPGHVGHHHEVLQPFITKSPRVLAFIRNREWVPLLANGKPGATIDCFFLQGDLLVTATNTALAAANRAREQAGQPVTRLTVTQNADAAGGPCSLKVEPRETDLLVLDYSRTGEQLYAELTRHGPLCHGYIVIHGTYRFGEFAEGDNLTQVGNVRGLLPAVRRFLQENPRWFVAKNHRTALGVTVLSCHPTDRKKLPPLTTMAANLVKAKTAYALDLFTDAPPEELDRRLQICSVCDELGGSDGARCSQCGCPVLKKAKERVGECPLGYWKHPFFVETINSLEPPTT